MPRPSKRRPSAADGLEAFAAGLHGRVIGPDAPDYDEARAIWNGMIDRRPAVIVRCAETADVIRAVRFAREHDLLVAVRGGGHNVAGTAVCDGGIVIDLSAMKGIEIDRQRAHRPCGARAALGRGRRRNASLRSRHARRHRDPYRHRRAHGRWRPRLAHAQARADLRQPRSHAKW